MWHLKLAAAFGVVGFLFTSRPWLNWLNTLTPELGLLIKSILVFGIIAALQGIDGLIKLSNSQTLGVVLVYTAFVMIFNYQSKWIEESDSPNVELQTADGVVYHRTRNLFNLEPEMARLVTFVVVPVIMVLIGTAFMRKGQNVNLD